MDEAFDHTQMINHICVEACVRDVDEGRQGTRGHKQGFGIHSPFRRGVLEAIEAGGACGCCHMRFMPVA